MYQMLPNIIFGFHGCSKSTFDSVIHNGMPLTPSANDYDWLGNGIYFWEQNYTRAKEWAKSKFGEDGMVIGAALNLGHCLNLTDSASSDMLREGYQTLVLRCNKAGLPLPKNRPAQKTKDILLRDLDCAVIQQVHDILELAKQRPYDSVRGIFTEGDFVYPGSALQERTHIQICICNPNCIKGYFAPLMPNSKYPML